MEFIESIIDSIKSIYNVSEDNISSLTVVLANIEKNKLYNRFNLSIDSNNRINDSIISKVNILTALLEIVLENPDLEVLKNEEKNELIAELCMASSSLYEHVVESVSETECWLKLRYLVMYSMLAYMADQQTVSDIVITNYHNKLVGNMNNYFVLSSIDQLESNTFYIIVLLLSNLRNYAGLERLNLFIEKANESLEIAQQEQIDKETIDSSSGFRIAAYGNIIYLVTILKDYLFTGEIDVSNNQDIFSVIDMYSFNAFHLLENENIELRIIGHLIRYAFHRIVDNSIWNIAEKSPLIRKFIEDNLSNGKRFLYTLLPSQRDVISDVLTPKKSVVVGMPTSSGKSFLAEMQILFSIHNFKTESFLPTVCYIVPTNALLDQVKLDLQTDFDTFNFCIETALPYYEVDEIENELLTREHIDILIATPEKLEALVRQKHPSIQNTRLVIMDEAHNLGEESRGSKFELVLSIIKQNIKEANFLLLSPFIHNNKEISEWLADNPRNASTISVEWSPTNQYIGCNLLNSKKTESILEFYKSARNHLIKDDLEIKLRLNPCAVKDELQVDSIDNAVRICVILNDFLNQDGNTLVLCGGRGTTTKLALAAKNYFTAKKMLPDMSGDYDIQKAIEIVRLENGENDSMIDCLKAGVCYHNSGLSSLVKEAIEDLVRQNKIKVIFATTTLAQGMNFPINTVIFDTVKLRNKGYLSNAEFWNIAGRAGRAYKDKEGYILISYESTQKNTKNLVKKYIESDLKDVISSLNSFFTTDNMISFDYNVLKDPKNGPILNLLQYINHIINISYDYNISSEDITKIRGILTDSYLYHSLSRQEGYVAAQLKLNNFVTQYVRHINNQKKEDLVKADELGISDVSFTAVKSMIGAFIHELRNANDYQYKASEIILQTHSVEKLSRIVNIIARIPEIKIEMIGQGKLDSDSIAKLLLGWVNGDSVKDIAKAIKRTGQSDSEVLSICNQYLNSQMKSYMPWGINIYQMVSYDMQTENAKMLPSYIYYGVSSKEAVVLSKLGVPRFAINNVLKVLKKKNPNRSIDVAHMKEIKMDISLIEATEYSIENTAGSIMKDIIDKRIC